MNTEDHLQMPFIIQTKSLNFSYSASKKVIDDLSIHVPKGSIYGFLGPNGAGKSTMMRLLTGILLEHDRRIELFGQSLQDFSSDIFKRVGALVESPALYLHLSGIDNLRYIAKLRHLSEDKIPETLELVDLAHAGNMKAKRYSLGMKQRLAIAMALLSEPELLLLDEPVNGLDPNGIVEIRKLLIRLNEEKGITIFVSSHLLSEIEKMCTHVGIIHHGKLRFEGTMQALAEKTGKCNLHITISDAETWKANLETSFPHIEILDANKLSIQVPNRDEIPALIRQLVHEGAQLYEIKIVDGLEEWFMTITE